MHDDSDDRTSPPAPTPADAVGDDTPPDADPRAHTGDRPDDPDPGMSGPPTENGEADTRPLGRGIP